MAEVDKDLLRKLAEAAPEDIDDDYLGVRRAAMRAPLTPSAVISLLDESDAHAARIAELERDRVRLESEAMYGAAGFKAAKERIAELEKEGISLLETFVAIADYLGIDCKSAQKLPGKPSQVFIDAIKAREEAACAELERECERLRKDVDKRIEQGRNSHEMLNAVLRENAELRAQLKTCQKQLETVTEWYSNSLDVIREVSESIPGAAYMDPPDGGDVSIPEQIRRMAKDAERYRWLRSDESNGKVDLCVTKAYCDESCRYVVLVNEGADWAIDAAMKEGGV